MAIRRIGFMPPAGGDKPHPYRISGRAENRSSHLAENAL